MAPYLELAARDRDHSAYSRRKRKIEPQHEAGEGHFLRLSFTMRSFPMSVALRARDARALSRRAIHPGSGSGRTKNLRRRKRAGSASCSTVKRAPSKSARSGIAFSRAVRAVPWAPSEPPVALENCSKSTPQVDGAAVFASRHGSEVLGARAVWRLLWWTRLRVH